MPEKLHLLYPKTLSGRLEVSNQLRANVEVNDARALVVAGPRQIDIEEVRELSALTLRLEALCSVQPPVVPTSPPAPTSPIAPFPSPSVSMDQQPTPSKRALKGIKSVPPSYLGPAIGEHMTDEELIGIIESLTTRIENTLSTLVSAERRVV